MPVSHLDNTAIRAVVAGLLLGLASLAAPSHAAPPDLLGTWHVLIHYQDKATPNADAKRWEDRIWELKMEGSRLLWIDYPIVVFDNQTGRFENTLGRPSRVLDYWEPNGPQRAEIREGLAINHRGSRTKTLKGSPETGWTSAKKRRGYSSARYVTFEETWTIEFDGDLPTFIRDDVMGSASTESMEGRTSYVTEAIEKNGRVLRGTFDRDEGARHGTFRMTRAGGSRSVGSSGKNLTDLDAGGTTFNRVLAGKLTSLPGEHDEAWYRKRVEDGTLTSDDRYALRAAFEEQLRDALTTDNDRSAYRVILQNLAVRMEQAFVDDGKSLADLRQMMRDGELQLR